MQYPIPTQRAGFRTLQISPPPTWHIWRGRTMLAIDNRSVVDRLGRLFPYRSMWEFPREFQREFLTRIAQECMAAERAS